MIEGNLTSHRSDVPLDDAAASRHQLRGLWRHVTEWIALAFAIFHIYTAFFGVLVGIGQRVVHIGFALVLTFLVRRVSGGPGTRPTVVDILWAVGVLVPSIYLAWEGNALDARLGIVYTRDIVFGAFLTMALLEATRRLIGFPLPLICALAIGYAYLGPYMPRAIAHRGFGIEDITTTLFLSTEGVYGIATAVSATYIVLFIILGAMLKASGAISFFTDLSLSLFGRVRGGPAKVAVVASGLFGMISGSAIANVTGTGVITIPLMKRVGFSPRFAAAVEAVASSCGQFMPPVMASAAFVIAEILGISYWQVALGAFIPATLYYVALFVAVDMRAARIGIKGQPKNELPRIMPVLLDGGYLLLVPITLVVMLSVLGYSPLKAGIYAIAMNVLLFLIRELVARKEADRMRIVGLLVAVHLAVAGIEEWVGHWTAVGAYIGGLAILAWMARHPGRGSVRFIWTFVNRLAGACREGALGTLEVATCVGCAGIIIGMFMLTGLGLRISSMLVDLAGGSLPLLLVLTMTASLILGMGLPTLGAYIVLAILVAPALAQMGVPPLAAHLFIFYFGVISCITPPVALAAFAGAALAGSEPMRTGFVAWRLGLAVFIVPFMMVYNPELIMQGEWYNIVRAAVTAAIGASALAIGLEGFWLMGMTWWERVALVVASVLMIDAGLITDGAGVVLIGATYFTHAMRRRRSVVPALPAAR